MEISYPGRWTRTDKALEMAANKLFTVAGGDRNDKPNILIVLTDGKTNRGSKPYPEVLQPLQVSTSCNSTRKNSFPEPSLPSPCFRRLGSRLLWDMIVESSSAESYLYSIWHLCSDGRVAAKLKIYSIPYRQSEEYNRVKKKKHFVFFNHTKLEGKKRKKFTVWEVALKPQSLIIFGFFVTVCWRIYKDTCRPMMLLRPYASKMRLEFP